MTDELTLTVGGRRISGWTGISVTRGIEICPNSFEVSLTSDSPIYADAVGIQEGQACTVKLGVDLVITGWVETVDPGYDAHEHGVTISGRGRCADLVDCSAQWPTGFIGDGDLLTIANKLGSAYEPAITAKALAPITGNIPQFQINVGETPWSIIERIARQEAVLVYEDEAGNLVFAQKGATRMASGFQEGINVQAARARRSVAQRFSSYECSHTGTIIGELGLAGFFFFAVKDPNVTRNRRLYLVQSSGEGGEALVKRRATWEMNRRAGRGRAVALTTDSWRDFSGKLWTPNALVPASLPRLGLATTDLLISEVTFRRDNEKGTTADLTLMPPDALLPEPIQLQPQVAGVIGPPASTGGT